MHIIITEKSAHTFSAEEEKKFQTRLDNGYDLKTDPRYNLWLSIHGTNDNKDHDLVPTATFDTVRCKMCSYIMCVYITCMFYV